MNTTEEIKFTSDITIEEENMKVKEPFEITSDKDRRFIRFEICAPMAMRNLRDCIKGYVDEDQRYNLDGRIVNISSNGLLIDCSHQLEVNDPVLMSFHLTNQSELSDIVGMVKKVEEMGTSYLIGIEFVAMETFQDKFSAAEMKMMENCVGSFNQKVKAILEDHLYQA